MALSRPLAAGLALVAAAAGPTYATQLETAPAQRICAPASVLAACADVPVGAGVLAETDATSGDTRPLAGTCTWKAQVHNGVSEWVLRVDATAAGADRVAAKCVFLVGGVQTQVSTSRYAPGSSYGELYVTRTASGPAVSVRCLSEVTAVYPDGHVKTRTEDCQDA